MKMKFEQFTEEVVNKIREFLPESFADARVELQTVTKNNDLKLTGLTIRCADNNVCPTIYLEQFYDKYTSGEDMGEILSDIADVRVRNEAKGVFDVEQITDFERVKGLIVPRLIGEMWNKSLLEQRPHKIVADLAVTYHIMLKQDMDGTASVPITNSLMNSWEVDVDTLHSLALQNMPVLLPSTFQSMSTVLSEMLCRDMDEEAAEQLLSGIASEDEFMYVLSNERKVNGASALLDKNIMQTVVDKFGEDFYIIPSSVHECIVVKASADMDTMQLTEMIEEVNSGQVAPEERLSDHPYKYTLKSGLLSI